MAESHQEELREVVSLEHHFSAPIALIIEPWADQVILVPNRVYTIVAKASTVGSLHVEFRANQITVYGWPGSTLSVLMDGESIVQCSIPAPSIPAATRQRQR
jgi:hypothetical protein